MLGSNDVSALSVVEGPLKAWVVNTVADFDVGSIVVTVAVVDTAVSGAYKKKSESDLNI